MEDKELEELIKKETKELAEKQFINGVLAGWNACLFDIKKEISGLNSSKKIKKLIDRKINEFKNRAIQETSENKTDENLETEIKDSEQETPET